MHARNLSAASLAVLMAFAMGMGCSSDDDPVTPPEPTPLAVSGTLGPAGGTLTSDDGRMSLTVPPGALGTDQEISITEVDPSVTGTLYAGLGVVHAFEIAPAGLDLGPDAVWNLRFDWAQEPAKIPLVNRTVLPGAVVSLKAIGETPPVRRLVSQLVRLSPRPGTKEIPAEITIDGLLGDRFAIVTLPESEPGTGSVWMGGGVEGPASVEEGSPFIIGARLNFAKEFDSITNYGYESGGPIVGASTSLLPGDLLPPVLIGTLPDNSTFADFSPTFTAGSFTGTDAEIPFGVSFRYEYDQSYLDQVGDFEWPTGTLQAEIGFDAFRTEVTEDTGPIGVVAEGVWPLTLGGLEGFSPRIKASWPYFEAVFGAGSGGVGAFGLTGTQPFNSVSDHLRAPGLIRVDVFALRLTVDFKAPGDDRVAVVSVGPTGGLLTQWFPENDAFGLTLAFANGSNLTDGQALNADPPGRSFLYVDNTNSRVSLQHYNDQTDFFDFEGPFSSFPAATGRAVTAAAREEGSLLVVTDGNPGQLFLHDRASSFADAVLITEVGDGPRRLRVLGEIAVVSNFSAGTLTVLTWDAADNIVVRQTVPVGDGPVGIDLVALAGGQVGIVSTGFNDNTWSVTVVDAVGGLVSNVKTTLPAGATAPGHAIWLDDEGNQVLISCNGSDNVVVAAAGL